MPSSLTSGCLEWLSQGPRVVAIAAAAVLLLVSSSSLAAPVTVPTGLLPGAQYRLAFVTTGTSSALSTLIADYDALVQAEANAVPALNSLATTWQVIGSSSAGDAKAHTGTSGTGVPIYLLNDVRLVDNYTDLWDGTVDVPLDVDTGGLTLVTDVEVWTGTFANGTTNSTRWLGNAGGQVAFGTTAVATGFWVALGANTSSQQRHLYGISAVLTVPVPEPAAVALLAMTVVALLLVRSLRASSEP